MLSGMYRWTWYGLILIGQLHSRKQSCDCVPYTLLKKASSVFSRGFHVAFVLWINYFPSKHFPTDSCADLPEVWGLRQSHLWTNVSGVQTQYFVKFKPIPSNTYYRFAGVKTKKIKHWVKGSLKRRERNFYFFEADTYPRERIPTSPFPFKTHVQLHVIQS